MEEKKETVEDVNVEETGTVGTQANENKDEEKAENTLTQSEVNALLKKEKEKWQKKMPSAERLKALEDFEESQKTAEQKQAEKEAEYQKTLAENKALKNTNAVLEAGVNRKFVKFISFEVSQMEGNFDENLSKFLSQNPEYLEGKEEPKATGTQVKSIGSTETDGVAEILKKKHPDMKF